MDWARSAKVAALVANPKPDGACMLMADAIGDYFDGYGDPAKAVSADRLEQMAEAKEPILLEMLAGMTGPQRAIARNVFSRIAGEIDTETHYAMILHRIGDKHLDHASVLMMYLDWYEDQLNRAIAWLLDGSGGEPPQ